MSEFKNFILVNVVPPDVSPQEASEDLEELKSLVTTFGGAEIVRVIQRRDYPDNATYIGSGKAQEMKEIAYAEKVDCIVINAIVKPTQLFNLKKMLWSNDREIEVWDRVDLILQIFSRHAHTAESKLQIELAAMRHMGPRIYGMGMVMSRQGGGIGTRGIGETNTELMKRHWRDAMKTAQDKLAALVKNREKQLEQRKNRGLDTVSIVGYTNAGKSSLFNAITKKNKLVENALFATLDSAVGQMYLPALNRTVLTSDTIGFIQKLPPELIDAFKSTLLESLHADLLLHVIDITDPKMEHKIEVVDQILNTLGAEHKPKIYVFNKTDAPHQQNVADLKKKYQPFNPQFVSAVTKEGTPELLDAIANTLAPQEVEEIRKQFYPQSL